MATHEIHLELLLGKPVFDAEDYRIGRIEEVRVEQQGDEWVIQEYLVGSIAILERLSAWSLGLSLLHLMGARKIHGGYRVPWDKLDLENLDRPRLRCTLQALKELNSQLEKAAQPEASQEQSKASS